MAQVIFLALLFGAETRGGARNTQFGPITKFSLCAGFLLLKCAYIDKEEHHEHVANYERRRVEKRVQEISQASCCCLWKLTSNVRKRQRCKQQGGIAPRIFSEVR